MVDWVRGSYDQLKSSHRGRVDEYPGNGAAGRQDEWTDSIAVGSKSFIEKVKALPGFKAKGVDVMEGGEGYHLREEPDLPIGPFSGPKRTL